MSSEGQENMYISDTKFKDVKILNFNRKEDVRGVTEVTVNKAEMEKAGIHFECREQRIYHVAEKGTFYGIHFQTKSHPQDKLIHLLTGRGMDYIIDLKKDSPTYKEWIAIELSGGDNKHLYIPQGYGHAFLSLEDGTTQLFTVSGHFQECGSVRIRFDDWQIGLSTPIDIRVMSEYDRNTPYLEETDFEV